MATDTFLTTSGAQAWDVATNWSLGLVPQSTNDVVYTSPAASSSTVTIAAADPAYTIASLTETTPPTTGFPTTTALTQELFVSGHLMVTGATSISGALLYLDSKANVVLNTVTLSNSGEISGSIAGTATLSIGSLTSSSSGTVDVFSGTATIGSVSGLVSVDVGGTGTAIIGTSAGTSAFGLNGGRLDLQSNATTFSDLIQAAVLGETDFVDLLAIAYQPGETAAVTPINNTFPSSYSIALMSSAGQTLYTFQKVQLFGSPTSSTAPIITVSSDGVNGTLVSIACYLAATRIAVPGGEARADELEAGDLVTTASGGAKPVKWIGRRSYAGRFLAANPKVQPIRFLAGSLGDGLPLRDLLVSPEHAMFVDGLLIPARLLTNRTTIFQERGLERVDYVHIELDQHEVIFAEGAPSETFVNDGSRGMFHNASEYAARFPGVEGPAEFCAPRVEGGYELEHIRQRLAEIGGPKSLAH